MRAEREKRAVMLDLGGRARREDQCRRRRQATCDQAVRGHQAVADQRGPGSGARPSWPSPRRHAGGACVKWVSHLSDRGGIEAMQLRIGEEYVKQFGKLAQAGTTLVVPANLTDLASIVTMATSIARQAECVPSPALPRAPEGQLSDGSCGKPSQNQNRASREFVAAHSRDDGLLRRLPWTPCCRPFPIILRALQRCRCENHGQWIRDGVHDRAVLSASSFWGIMSDRFGRRPHPIRRV